MSDLPEKIGPVPVDKPWHKFRELMVRKVGPLPIWAWTLAGGGVIAAVILMHGKIPGMGALSGQTPQDAQGAGGGSGSGGDVSGPPPSSSPPGGGSTPPPSQPPLLDGPPPIGQQAGGTGGTVAPSAKHIPGIATRHTYDAAAYHGSLSGGVPLSKSAAQEIVATSADYSTAAHTRPGITGKEAQAQAEAMVKAHGATQAKGIGSRNTSGAGKAPPKTKPLDKKKVAESQAKGIGSRNTGGVPHTKVPTATSQINNTQHTNHAGVQE